MMTIVATLDPWKTWDDDMTIH